MDKKFSIGGIISLVVMLVIAIYMIAYTFPGAASVASNSTGKWGAGVNAGVFALGAIVVPLILIVVVMMYFVKKATE